MKHFENLAQLRLSLNRAGQTVHVKSHTTLGDGGGGDFWLDTSDTSTADDNGINIVDAQSPRTGTWKRIYSGEFIKPSWFGITADGVADDTASMAAALLAAGDGNVIRIPDTVKVTAPLSVGNADNQELQGGEVLGSGITEIVELGGTTTNFILRSVAFSGVGIAVSTLQTATSASNTGFLLDGIHATDVSAIVNMRGGTLNGAIVNAYGKDLTDRGINIGYNDLTAQANWGGVAIFGAHIDTVHPADTNSHYGIISYSPHSRIMGSYINDIGSNTGSDTEGIYTKAKFSTVIGNVLTDAGQGEAALNIKGGKIGEVTNPEGYNICAVGNNISYTTAYTAASPTDVHGIKCLNDNIVASASVAYNFTGYGIYTTGGEIDNLALRDSIIVSAQANNGGIGILCDGNVHSSIGDVVDLTGSSAPALRISGQTVETRVKIASDALRGGTVGALIKPATDDILDIEVDGTTFTSNTNQCVKTETARTKSLKITNNNFLDAPSDVIDVGTGAGTGSVYISGNAGLGVQTTDATATAVCEIPIARGGVTSLRLRLVGSDGTNYWCEVVEVAYSNAAGTVAIVGTETSVHQVNSAGAAGWVGLGFTAGTDKLSILAEGAVATTIDWKVDVMAIG